VINLAPKLSAAVDRGKCGLSTCGRQAVATAAAVNLIKGLWQRRNKWAITSLVFPRAHWSCHSQVSDEVGLTKE